MSNPVTIHETTFELLANDYRVPGTSGVQYTQSELHAAFSRLHGANHWKAPISVTVIGTMPEINRYTDAIIHFQGCGVSQTLLAMFERNGEELYAYRLTSKGYSC
jgi:hypothetical protein